MTPRRPTAPRPGAGRTSRRAPAPTREREPEPAPRPAPTRKPEPAPTRKPKPAPRPAPAQEPAAPEPAPERGRVVESAGRFRGLLRGRPWRRRRRAIIAGSLVTVLVLGAALAALIWLPALRLQQVTVEGLGYVPEETVIAAADDRLGDSVLLLPTDAVAEEIAQVPGVADAEVERDWPDGMRVTVTESAPVAQLTRPDGSTAVLDADGTELPPAAGEGASLVPMTVDPASADPEGAREAMSEVLAELPEALRGAVTEVTAASRSDVTLVLALEDGGSKTVVWGDARDAELKAEVVQALLGQPGSVIDVSSPVAPVTR